MSLDPPEWLGGRPGGYLDGWPVGAVAARMARVGTGKDGDKMSTGAGRVSADRGKHGQGHEDGPGPPEWLGGRSWLDVGMGARGRKRDRMGGHWARDWLDWPRGQHESDATKNTFASWMQRYAKVRPHVSTSHVMLSQR